MTFGATFLIGLGFSSVLAAAPQAFDAIRIAGSLYVLWLAWKLGTAGRAGHQEAKAASFWDGAVLLILNPKAYVIIALMFSQFLVATSSVLQVAVISVIFTLNNLVPSRFGQPLETGWARRFGVKSVHVISMPPSVLFWRLLGSGCSYHERPLLAECRAFSRYSRAD